MTAVAEGARVEHHAGDGGPPPVVPGDGRDDDSGRSVLVAVVKADRTLPEHVAVARVMGPAIAKFLGGVDLARYPAISRKTRELPASSFRVLLAAGAEAVPGSVRISHLAGRDFLALVEQLERDGFARVQWNGGQDSA